MKSATIFLVFLLLVTIIGCAAEQQPQHASQPAPAVQPTVQPVAEEDITSGSDVLEELDDDVTVDLEGDVI